MVGDGPAAEACRRAVAHVLYLDDDDERDRWRSVLAQCEAALLDGTPPPRPGMVNLDVARALADVEQAPPQIDALNARDNSGHDRTAG